jgi:hypothetical protein
LEIEEMRSMKNMEGVKDKQLSFLRHRTAKLLE